MEQYIIWMTIEELEASPFENDEMHRNIIDKDFFLGKDKPKYSQKDVEQIFDDVIFLKNGSVVLEGPVDDIRSEKEMSIDALFREVFKC